MTFPGTSPAAQPAKKEPSKGAQIVGGIVVLVVAAFCVGGAARFVFGGHGGSGSSPTPPADQSAEAKWACEEFVKKQLKAPASAKFSDESSAKIAGTEYVASGSVDSQNSFGALLRSTFACDITYDASTQQWTSKSVSVKPG